MEEDGRARCACDEGYEAVGLMCEDTSGADPTTNQIVQWGVAWTFDEQVSYGRFANGDFWVLGPATVTDVRPRFSDGHHGLAVNPTTTVRQGFDARIADWDETLVPALP